MEAWDGVGWDGNVLAPWFWGGAMVRCRIAVVGEEGEGLRVAIIH
jgi:hypothetical protein